MKKNRHLLTVIICMMLICGCGALISSCRGKESVPAAEGGFHLYYVSHDKTGLRASAYTPQAAPSDTRAYLEEALGAMTSAADTPASQDAPISGTIVLREYVLEDGILTLDFDVRYLDTDHVTEILHRAAIVKTLTQIEGVDGVCFLVSGTPLMRADDEPYGVMNGDLYLIQTGGL